MMRYFLKIPVLLILVMAAPVPADEHETVEVPAQEQPTTEARRVPDGDTPPAEPDSFVPSETISEDLSVPFPVDI